MPSTSTSYFTIGIGNASDPLPVSYVLLDAAYIGNNTADISFSPRGAEDIISFNIQKAVDDKKWHDIVSFSNSGADKYQFEDKNFTSEAYYRIAAKKRTGDLLYSPVKYLSSPIDKTDNIIYPNPAEDYVYVSLNSNQSKMLKVVTSTGRDVTGSIEVQWENEVVKLNIKKLPTGIYYLSADGIKYPFLKK